MRWKRMKNDKIIKCDTVYRPPIEKYTEKMPCEQCGKFEDCTYAEMGRNTRAIYCGAIWKMAQNCDVSKTIDYFKNTIPCLKDCDEEM
jgi:hypothetical protein